MSKEHSDNSKMYLLHIRGTVKENKHKEFNQSVSYLMKNLCDECKYYHIAYDAEKKDLLHLYSLWNSREALSKFLKSEDYNALLGAFDVLGSIQQSTLMQLLDQINISKKDLNGIKI